MRVKMLEAQTVTVDGVSTRELDAGDELEMGAGIAADLIEAGKAEPVESESASPRSRGRKHADPDADAAKAEAARVAEEAEAARIAEEARVAEEAAAVAADEEAARIAADAAQNKKQPSTKKPAARKKSAGK